MDNLEKFAVFSDILHFDPCPERKKAVDKAQKIRYDIKQKNITFFVNLNKDRGLGYEKRGTNGFGYDPVFMTGEKSFAEISAEEKNAMSHRGRALEQLKEYLSK